MQRLFADNVGTRIVDWVATTLLDGPVSRTIIDGIAASPFAHLFLDAVSGAAAVVGPIETNMLVRVSPATQSLHLNSTGTHNAVMLSLLTLSSHSSKSSTLPVQEVQTYVGSRLRGATPEEALQEAEAAGSNLSGLDQGLSPPPAGSGRRLQDVSTDPSAAACMH